MSPECFVNQPTPVLVPFMKKQPDPLDDFPHGSGYLRFSWQPARRLFEFGALPAAKARAYMYWRGDGGPFLAIRWSLRRHAKQSALPWWFTPVHVREAACA